MKLSEQIKTLIDKIPAREAQEEQKSVQRWTRVSDATDEEPDYLPVVVHGFDRNRPGEKTPLCGHIRYPLAEQFDSPEKMLWEWLCRLVPLRRFPGDGCLCIAPRFGNAFLLSGLDLEVKLVNDTLWPARSLSRNEVLRLELRDDYAKGDCIARAIEFTRYAVSVLPEHIAVGLFFMMSPFDLAYLVRGNDIYLDMYDAPDAVHHLMAVCTDLFIRATLMFKREAGEPDDYYRYGSMALKGGGQFCEDCSVMLSPQMHRQFSIPYTERALEAIGGGWVHFCGDGRQIVDNYLKIPNLNGILYGQLHLNGDLSELLEKFEFYGKGFNRTIIKAEDENWLDFFRRFLKPLRRKKYVWASAGIYSDQGELGRKLLDWWHQAQDEKFSCEVA